MTSFSDISLFETMDREQIRYFCSQIGLFMVFWARNFVFCSQYSYLYDTKTETYETFKECADL